MANETLIDLRRKQGLNQAEAAKAIGVSQSMLSYLENGGRSGSDETKIKIAKYYKQSVESIFFTGKITKRDKESLSAKAN